MNKEKQPQLTVRIDDLAVPEIHIGDTPADQELEEDAEEIQYDTVAIPEFHPHKRPKGQAPR